MVLKDTELKHFIRLKFHIFCNDLDHEIKIQMGGREYEFQPNAKNSTTENYTHTHTQTDSLPTPTIVKAQWLQALGICAKHSVLFLAAGGCVAGCFTPQILTDALEGYNSLP